MHINLLFERMINFPSPSVNGERKFKVLLGHVWPVFIPMKILVLHGPNLNLLGSISIHAKQRTTLNKINKALRLHVRNSENTLKISQTHKVFQAINFIQRNRNWADGFLFAPMAWARYEYSILDALKVSDIPSVQLLFSNGFDDIEEKSSIFSNVCHSTIIGDPNQIYIDGIDILKTISWFFETILIFTIGGTRRLCASRPFSIAAGKNSHWNDCSFYHYFR